jgi:fructan beta-fructosidase
MDRPALHFSPVSGWMNDPNGLIWHDGVFHLYYQSDPSGVRLIYNGAGAGLGWGHATSTDLVHWTHHPMALPCQSEPDCLHARYSGSAVVDRHNVSGLGTPACPAPMLAFFSDMQFERRNGEWIPIRQPIGMAYSLDGGQSFVPYAANPVVPTDERKFGDPKVFWHEESRRWIMVNILGMTEGRIELWGSQDLLHWQFLSDVRSPPARRWECPDLFQLATPSGTKLWVLKFNGPRNYLVGSFDGTRFTPTGELPCPEVGPIYAEVTFNDMPDGRTILMGWLRESPNPDRAWVGMQSIPRELSLGEAPEGFCLIQQPARELRALRGDRHEVTDRMSLADGAAWELALPESGGQLAVRLDSGDEQALALDPAADRLSLHGSGGTHEATLSSLACRVFIDQRVVEVFADGGRYVATAILPHGRRPVEIRWAGPGPLVAWELLV